METNCRTTAFSSLALVPIRLVLGIIFVAHGGQKLFGLFGGDGFAATVESFAKMGFLPSTFWAGLVGGVEFFGGIALILGFLTQPIALFIAIEMVVATLWRISKNHPFVSGYELDLTLALLGFVLATSGGGIYALDNLWPFIYY